MNEKGKDFISYNKPYIYTFSRPSWSIAHGHGVSTQHVHTQWHCLLLLGQSHRWVHVLKYILLIPLND